MKIGDFVINTKRPKVHSALNWPTGSTIFEVIGMPEGMMVVKVRGHIGAFSDIRSNFRKVGIRDYIAKPRKYHRS